METVETSARALRRREWRRQRRESWRQVCVTCGGIFTPRRSDGIYCSAACSQKAYRRRLAGETAPARPRAAPWRVSTRPGVLDMRKKPEAVPRPAQRARDLAEREAERAREATRRAIDLAHSLIG
jgi:hypothetical protein